VFAYSVYCLAHDRIHLVFDHEKRYMLICYGLPLIFVGAAIPFDDNDNYIFHSFAYDLPVNFIPYLIVLAFNCVCYFKAYQTFKIKLPGAIKQIAMEMLTYPMIFLVTWAGLLSCFAYFDSTKEWPNATFLGFTRFMIRFEGFLNALVYGMTPSVRSRLWSYVKRRRAIKARPDMDSHIVSSNSDLESEMVKEESLTSAGFISS